MDAALSEQAALFGYSEGGPMCALCRVLMRSGGVEPQSRV